MSRDSFLWLRRAVVIGIVASVGACGTPSKPTATATANAPAGPKPTLAQERRRLAGLFEGTPVTLVIDRDGSLRAEVPLRHCFDPAHAVVKAPLAALLDRLAGSPATRGGTWAVAAAGDPKSKGASLALERAASTRDYLVGKGAEPLHFSVAALGVGSDAVGVRVVVNVPPAAAPVR
jgi:hypothetical protein